MTTLTSLQVYRQVAIQSLRITITKKKLSLGKKSVRSRKQAGRALCFGWIGRAGLTGRMNARVSGVVRDSWGWSLSVGAATARLPECQVAGTFVLSVCGGKRREAGNTR